MQPSQLNFSSGNSRSQTPTSNLYTGSPAANNSSSLLGLINPSQVQAQAQQQVQQNNSYNIGIQNTAAAAFPSFGFNNGANIQDFYTATAGKNNFGAIQAIGMDNHNINHNPANSQAHTGNYLQGNFIGMQFDNNAINVNNFNRHNQNPAVGVGIQALGGQNTSVSDASLFGRVGIGAQQAAQNRWTPQLLVNQGLLRGPIPNVNNQPLQQNSMWENDGSITLQSHSRRNTPTEVKVEEVSQTDLNIVELFPYNGKQLQIRNVWAENLKSEMALIRSLLPRFSYVAMDTEFPGVVARPIGTLMEAPDYNYQTLRCNVDLLNLIQLGISFADENGELATIPSKHFEEKNAEDYCCCWQFHFKFSLRDDLYAQDSIDLLRRSGIDFKLHEEKGIEVQDFGELLVSSGLVLMPDVHWISFHGSYDFGYLMKVLTCSMLPDTEKEFFELLRIWFPRIYDVKHIVKKIRESEGTLELQNFKGGLSRLAEILNAERIGPMHQAGSDSLLTLNVFFKIKRLYFADFQETDFDHEFAKARNIIHGLSELEDFLGVSSPERPLSNMKANYRRIAEAKHEKDDLLPNER